MEKYGVLVCALQFLVLFSILTTSNTTKITKIGPCRLVRDGTCPDNEHVKFHLFTSSYPSSGQLIDLTDETSLSTYNEANPTKIIIHSTSKKDHPGLVKIREAYLSSGSYNVIVVDYDELISTPKLLCYVSNRANAPHAAQCIAQLIDKLRTTSDIHVIGFGLGAHIASIVAVNLKPYVLPRITGLDPSSYLVRNLEKKLDESDATFVDVIHTNALFKGTIRRTGHVDFYMNGGTMQPGCSTFLGIGGNECSHDKAPLYFAESITSSEGFWGWVCSGYFTNFLGRCSVHGTQVLMGERVPHEARGYVYVNTSSEAPFALGRLGSSVGKQADVEEIGRSYDVEEATGYPSVVVETQDNLSGVDETECNPSGVEETQGNPSGVEETQGNPSGVEEVFDIDTRSGANGK